TRQGDDHEFEYRMRAADGRIVWIRDHVRVISEDGIPARLHGVMIDITPVKQAEESRLALEKKIQSAQRMESLAVLAGGIAHDFNNLLVGILGNAGLILEDLPPESPILDRVRGIEKAAVRAAELTHQMLAYSGKGRFLTEFICLNRLIEETAYLLQASISKKAVLKYDLLDALPSVEADPTQLRQVAMNLLTNASDAIGSKSGLIVIRTGLVEADAQYLAGSYVDDSISAGQYVFLEISDTGCGIDEKTLSMIFDPFFSTKSEGRGLGLAATLGIIRGHSGTLKVNSEPGKGTTFKILLPVSKTDLVEPSQRTPPQLEFTRGGKALVMDDDETVCSVLKGCLELMGFDVFGASDGLQGTNIFRANPKDYRVVFLDLTMPHMNGEETFRVLRALDPECKVVLMSGYSGQDATSRFVGKGLAGFLQKPFKHQDVVEVLAGALA
ncbi:MAG: two-component system cell cycle sensor histidine kinase/response regulator CckA, partial [Candidatus Paceibacteria bacterium]